MAEPAENPEAGQGPSLLRRRWKAVVLGILLGLAAGQLFTAVSTPRYSSTTSVLVLPTRTTTASATGGAASEVNMNTESELVRSAQVAGGAATTLKSTEPLSALLERLTVTVPPNSQVLSIAYADRTAQLAQQGARAVAQAYLASREADVDADVERLTGALRKDLEFAEEQLRLATDKAASLPTNSPDRVYAEAQRDILGSQITNLNSRLTTLTAGGSEAGVIITDAVLPARASFPVPWLDLAAGLFLGLLLGLALALLVDRLDHRVRRGSDLSRRLGLPVLADLSGSSADTPGAFDRMRNTIDGRTAGSGSLQVTDPAGAGASGVVAGGLARSWAGVNGATTLVLAHPRSQLSASLGLSGRPGLSELLRGQVHLEEVLHGHPEHPGLLVVPPGREPDALESLLQSPAGGSVLAAISGPAALVVIESLGTSTSAAAQALAASSGAVVLVAESGSDDRLLAREVRGVEQMGGALAGVVLVPRTRGGKNKGAGSAADGATGTGTAGPERVPEPASASGGPVAARRPPS